MGENLAFVVGRAAGKDVAIFQNRLERRRIPEVERIRRLHIVVPINHDGLAAGLMFVFRPDHRMSRRRKRAALRGRCRSVSRPANARIPSHLFGIGVVGRDAGKSQESENTLGDRNRASRRLEQLRPTTTNDLPDAHRSRSLRRMNEPAEPAAEKQLIRALGVPEPDGQHRELDGRRRDFCPARAGRGAARCGRAARLPRLRAGDGDFRHLLRACREPRLLNRRSLCLRRNRFRALRRLSSPACFIFSPRSSPLPASSALFADTIGAMAPIFAHRRDALPGRPARLRRARLDQYPGRSIRRPRGLDS